MLIMYLVMTSMILLNGLIGIFSGCFRSDKISDKDAFDDNDKSKVTAMRLNTKQERSGEAQEIVKAFGQHINTLIELEYERTKIIRHLETVTKQNILTPEAQQLFKDLFEFKAIEHLQSTSEIESISTVIGSAGQPAATIGYAPTSSFDFLLVESLRKNSNEAVEVLKGAISKLLPKKEAKINPPPGGSDGNQSV